jgi:hypothetical protein
MAKVGVKFKVKGSFAKELRALLTSLFSKKVQNNFGDFRPIIEAAIDEGVINTRAEFIPDDDEAAELGIGANGSIDNNRTQNAWGQLLVGSTSKAVTFSVRKDTKKNRIGRVVVQIDERAFYDADLSNVPTPDSDVIDSIPWMEWLIEGAPSDAVEPNYEFTSKTSEFGTSRTGEGRMIWKRGGMWTFPPARLGAFVLLSNEIERQIEIAIRRDIGKVL